MSGFHQTTERLVYQGHVVSLAVATFAGPDGTTFERDIVHHPGAVAVVAPLDDGTVVLVRQYRAALDRELLELPAGVRDVPGEDPAVTARRELAEEVGLEAGSLELLTVFHNSPGCSDEQVWVYLATDLTATSRRPQGVEEHHMAIEHLPLDYADDAIRRGVITDAKTIIGLSLARRHLDR